MVTQKIINYSIICAIVCSYALGFYFNEDSAGGGKIDLINSEWGNYLLFKEKPLQEALTSLDFKSSRTPLFLIIHKYNFFINDINDFRFFSFCLGFFCFFFFYICLKKIFKNSETSYLLLIASFILLSPYLRSSLYWANQEHLSILFFLISLIFFYFCIDNTYEKSSKNYYLYSILCSFFCYLSFYIDQKFFFMAVIIFYLLIQKTSKRFFFLFSIINFVFLIPALFLFYLWGGIVPIESQSRLLNTPSNINILISNVGIYFIPLFFGILLKRKFKLLSLNKLEIASFLIISVLIYVLVPTDPAKEGSGIIFRLMSVLYFKNWMQFDWGVYKLVYFVINLIFIYFLIIFLKKSIKNLIIISSFFTIYFLTYFTYQSYVDPIFIILIYAFLDLKNINIMNKEITYLNLFFFTLILSSSIVFRVFLL